MKRANKHPFLGFTVFAFLLLSAPFHVARAGSACHYIEQADLAIVPPGRSKFPTVDGEINGQPVKLAIDTGAYATFMMRSEADRQSLHPVRTRSQVQGVGGNASIFTVNIKDIAIGGAHAKNMRFPVLESLEDTGVAGIIGVDFLLQYDVELNLAEHRVKLFRADHCQDKALAYWDSDALTVPMEFMADSSRPRVQVKINGVPVWALIDTGAFRSVVDLDTVRKLGLSIDAPGVVTGGKAGGIGSGKRKLWHMTFDSFAIGDEVVQHPRIAIMDDAENYRGRKQHGMILGRDFLASHRVLLAQSQMLMYYSYKGGQVFLKDEIDAINLPRAAP